MKVKKAITHIFLMFLILSSSFIFIEYRATKEKLSKLAISAVEIEEKNGYIDKGNLNQEIELDKPKLKKNLEEKILGIYSKKSVYAKEKLTFYFDNIDLLDSNYYSENRGIKDTEFKILKVDKNNAKGTLEGKAFTDKKANDGTSEDTYRIENKVKYKVDFVSEDGEWKVNSVELYFMAV